MEACICIVGDFQFYHEMSMKELVEERIYSRDIDCLDEFIVQSNLIDLPLIGKKFTYYRPDATCKSRLNRTIFNEEWIRKWPELNLKSLGRTVSTIVRFFSSQATRIGAQSPSNSSMGGSLIQISLLW